MEVGLGKGEPSTDYSKTVATTWTLSFAAVRKASPASAELLIFTAFLMPDWIPIELFTLGSSGFGGLLAQALKGVDEDSLVFWGTPCTPGALLTRRAITGRCV